ncbi:hypothetical protein [Lysinibacillus fusiformis]|uniref:hypothetical protein n=1 Tax=Lysinibacillus fusiformis TaxID=28031 RepID=UPI0023A98EAA|nr:hypothetical protein [Lysinibacillus fusiformis]WEA41169.1 hypothetical protein PWJ66_09600 [Lysinibacillus fusiformis]
MLSTTAEPSFDNQTAQKYVKKKLNEAIDEALWELWYVDADKLSALTCMSKRWLEDEFFCDVRMRAIEVRKVKKRWWPAKEAREVMKEITSEW